MVQEWGDESLGKGCKDAIYIALSGGKHASLPERTSLSVDDIINLLTLCLDATFLTFRGKVYKQMHRTAMGSPVSVVVANLVMEDVEELP